MKYFLPLIFSGLFLYATGQEENPFTKFGSITVEDLQKKFYAVDSNASAVILSDMGQAAIVGSTKGRFTMTFIHHKVIHILNKNGYGIAQVEIPLYTSGATGEKVDNIKGTSYNLVNGEIETTELDRTAIFTEKKSENETIQKFTMPNLKAGTIIEFEYKITSDYIRYIAPWHFQGIAPRLWSEFRLSVPQFFYYRVSAFGYHPLVINEKKISTEFYAIDELGGVFDSPKTIGVKSPVNNYRWAMKNVPELKEESYTSTLFNHVSRLEFQLAEQIEPMVPHKYLQNWNDVKRDLIKADYFGIDLSENNNWMADELKPLLAGTTSDYERARNIFAYVRDNFVCTNHSAILIGEPIRAVMKKKRGTVSEINLLLVAMLRKANLYASPVLLSTFHNGYVDSFNTSLTGFNYVVAQVKEAGKTHYLDASYNRLGFDKLLPDCYNGLVLVVNDKDSTLNLSADQLQESKLTTILIGSNEKGEWEGSMNQEPGYYESYHLRERIADKGKDDLIKDFTGNFLVPVKVKSLVIDSLNNYNEPVALHYQFKLLPEGGDLFYINPMFGEGYHKNPFNAAERLYPVEMPYPTDETYLLTFQVPEGYEVDELPKNVVAKLDATGKSFFDYRIARNGNIVSLRSRIKIAKTFFAPEEYDVLKSFFEMIVSKQSEQMVLKKKKG